MRLYDQAYLSEEHICQSLNLQTLASIMPKAITHPVPWYVRTQLDKFIAKNLIKSMNMSLKTMIDTFPNISIDFSNLVKQVKTVQ